MDRTARMVGLVAGVSLVAGLSACGGHQVTITDRTASGIAASGSGATASDAGAGATARQDADFALPELSGIVIPDVTSFTNRSQKYAEKLGDVAVPGSGVLVTGARCDPKGRVVNSASMTLIDHGDGSGVYDDAYQSAQNNGKGAGVYDDAYKTIKINGDGSGSYDDAYVTIKINKDGSGVYDDAYRTITVHSDGSGDYDDAYKTIKINMDGSGTYHDAYLDATVKVDGSGTYKDAYTTVVGNGDGTGTIDGESAKVAPFPLFAKVGKFPPVQALRPLGKSCGTLIRLDDRVLFDFDASVLRPQAGPVLDKVASSLTGVTTTLRVNGHTDAKGSDAYNLDLSRRRAQTVADALARRGVHATLVVTGFGESQPIAANELHGKDNPGGRQLNRRVEIIIPNG
jgi:OmpA-OmpF porin, OOP family